MSKTPIAPHQINAGDLIRFEWNPDEAPESNYGERVDLLRAAEYVARTDGSLGGFREHEGTYYLLRRPERPTSPVPDTDTLGWLHRGEDLMLGVWRTHDYRFTLDGVGRSALQNERDIPVDQVTGFTPAIAVPVADETDAACAWSDYRKDYEPSAVTLAAAHKAFLAGWKAREGDQSGPIR